MPTPPARRIFAAAFFFAALVIIAPVLAADKAKVLYHVSFADKIPFVFDDIEERIDKAGGAEHLDIVLVVDGPALKAFLKNEAAQDVKRELAELQKRGVRSEVCGDAMGFYKLKTADLLPGLVRLEEGSIARIEALKAQGYEYVRF